MKRVWSKGGEGREDGGFGDGTGSKIAQSMEGSSDPTTSFDVFSAMKEGERPSALLSTLCN